MLRSGRNGSQQRLRFDLTLHDAHSGYGWQMTRIYDESGVLLALTH